jgi:integrase
MRKRRRGSGEGTIAFRPRENRWYARLSLGYEGGRRRRKVFYGSTEAEVRAKLLDARHDQSRGLPVTPKGQTVAQFLDGWVKHRANVRPRSYEIHEAVVRLHLVPELGKLRLEKLTPQHVQTLLDRKLKSRLSAQSVVCIRQVLRTALSEAVKFNLVARNVAALVSPPQIPHREIKPLDATEARAILDAARGTRFEAAYAIALNLGLRRGEILGLRWADIDFDRNTLRVAQALRRVDGKLQATETKTGRSRRTLSLPAGVVAALRTRRAHQSQERLLAGTQWQDSELIFTTGRGTPLDPHYLLWDFQRVLKRAGVPHVRFHDLRHSAASLLLAQGVPLRTIMEILGHASITITAGLYAHISAPMMRDAADKMDALLG